MANSFGIIPVPDALKAQSTAYDLKKRLDWGEPALTIIDARSRDDFNVSHISGAISLPVEELVERSMMNIELARDIYVYSSTDEQSAAAAEQLRNAGFTNVSEIRGGVSAWKASGFPIEGNRAVVA